MVVQRRSTAVAKPKHRKQDLIFLVWQVNTNCMHLQAKVPEGVTLDLQAGTWMFEGMTFLIGQEWNRPSFSALIEVPLRCYDRTKLEHLKALQRDIEWRANRKMFASGVLPRRHFLPRRHSL